MAQWECFLCAKKNNESEAASCVCCKRPRSYAPKSYIDATRAQPLAIHGLATGKHPFRPEQLETLVRGGLDLGSEDTVVGFSLSYWRYSLPNCGGIVDWRTLFT